MGLVRSKHTRAMSEALLIFPIRSAFSIIWSIWWVITLCGRHIEVTDNEVKMVNRSGRLVKSARFDEISELRFGSFISEPRNHWIVGVDGKKWLLSGYCENFQALAQLVEERTGKVFTEHATARKMKQAS